MAVAELTVNLFLCQNGSPTTSPVTGGQLLVAGPLGAVVTTFPYDASGVSLGHYSFFGTPPAGYEFVACGTSPIFLNNNLAVYSVNVVAGDNIIDFYVIPVTPPPPPTLTPMNYVIKACGDCYSIPYAVNGSAAFVTVDNLPQAGVLFLGSVFADYVGKKFGIKTLQQIVKAYLAAPFVNNSGSTITVDVCGEITILNYVVQLDAFVGSLTPQLVTYSAVLVSYKDQIYTLQNNSLSTPSIIYSTVNGLNTKVLNPITCPTPVEKGIDINYLLVLVNKIYNVMVNYINKVLSQAEAQKQIKGLLCQIPSKDALQVVFPPICGDACDPLVVYVGNVNTSAGCYQLAFSVKQATLPILGTTALLEFIVSPIPYLGEVILSP